MPDFGAGLRLQIAGMTRSGSRIFVRIRRFGVVQDHRGTVVVVMMVVVVIVVVSVGKVAFGGPSGTLPASG